MDASDVRARWASRTGEYSPRYYAYYGPDEVSEALESTLEEHVSQTASILELGCSSGRHLKYLHDHGYEDVAGVEINDEALDVMREEYPVLADRGTFFSDSIESVVESLADDAYDVVYSVQTLQHIHSEAEWVFDSLARITEQLLITVEIEGADRRDGDDVSVRDIDGLPITYRNWRDVFDDERFSQVHASDIGNNTMRVFARNGR
ncbi:SAM-dependent methyltransferase [Halanaeroarchaeum sp. HSR-CO]|uniref:class I SAM-dependent methyltransferase n=1 Tax=Halanaeroarchaeum sp. HSR-CO TaxID=2866382 RepID=UPI00217EEECE|nr:class I SAM-dependent methyltransferase [Halanaeroarchaeum sp. HSR-CO]UWG47707.1 SAM-dependent methyltransferase [Halanaeroarchaeum sp. HSR-CO]